MSELIVLIFAALFATAAVAQTPAQPTPKVDKHGHKEGEHKHDEKKEKAAKKGEAKDAKK